MAAVSVTADVSARIVDDSFAVVRRVVAVENAVKRRAAAAAVEVGPIALVNRNRAFAFDRRGVGLTLARATAHRFGVAAVEACRFVVDHYRLHRLVSLC